MQTRTYGELFKLISALCGTGQQLTVPEQDQLRQFINRRFQEAFDSSPVWPRYFVPSEAREIISLVISGLATGSSSDESAKINGNYILLGQDRGTAGAVEGSNVYYNPSIGTRDADGQIGSATVIYKRASTKAWTIEVDASAQVFEDGAVEVDVEGGEIVAVEADTNKKDNPSKVKIWTLTATLVSGTPLIVNEQFIPYAQTGKNTIGDFNRIHRKEAFLNNSAIEYEFFVDFNGANILNVANSTDKEAFVSYKKQFTPYTITSGYYDSTLEVPQEFFSYIAHTSFADFLRMQGKSQEAIAEEGVGTAFLAQELEKIDLRSNNNTVNKRFTTYVSRQSR